jgi:ubiquinone/menaquinone biosynthesis C-methylase UbiE/uncharacterized protein YbaR (Trm112 family)
MSFRTDAVRLLSCPFCTSPLRLATVFEEASAGVEYGLLACDACGFDYPIVAGIAIIGGPNERLDSKDETSADSVIRGPQINELVELLKTKGPALTLTRLLNPTALRGDLFPAFGAFDRSAGPSTSRVIARRLDQALGRRYRDMRRLARRAVARVALPRARARLNDHLTRQAERLSAVDVMDLYYQRYSGAETSNYFVYRFGQPRHLSALGLAALLNNSDGPLLDLACGVGHLTHFFAASRPGRTVLGADRDFFRLLVASRYVAPTASYVCTPADQALPFADGVLDGVFCSDAFHLFLHRAMSVREIRRILSPEGVLAVARFGNAAVEPREGYELKVDGYKRLFAGFEHVVIVGEETVLAQYLDKRAPDLTGTESTEELASQKWLSAVASRSRRAFVPGTPFSTFPHAVGRLQLNPIYAVEGTSPSGDLDLRFVFPSDWYRFENQTYLRYAPERCRVSGDVARALAARQPHPELDDLIRQCVVIGMPDRYATAA